MNELIRMLKKHVDEKEQEYKKKKRDFEEAEKAYKKALTTETMRKKFILAKNFFKVVDIIHKNDLRCVYMRGMDPPRDGDPYVNPCFIVQDRDEDECTITVQDGKVCGTINNGFSSKWRDELVYDLELFCETMENKPE